MAWRTDSPGISLGLIAAGLLLAALGVTIALRRPVGREESAGSPAPAATALIWFDEVAAESGIDFQHVSGQAEKRYFPEIMSGGVGLIDYDRDGHLDVYFVQGGRVVGPPPDRPGNRLYRNLGNGRFADVTAQAGVGDKGYGMGCACGDFDNDGWTDIYVTNVGPSLLYRNNGDGTFSDVTDRAGVGDPSFGSSAAFTDYDHDGDLDLFVVNYTRWSAQTEIECFAPNGRLDYCGPTNYQQPAPDTLYRNEGDGTFTNVTRSAGIAAAFGNGLGIVATDLDGDGWTDFAVANDLMANQLWINNRDGTFREEGLVRGMAYNGEGFAESGMGIDAQDIDDDGDSEVFMTHFDGLTNTLYINDGGLFDDRTSHYGLMGSLPFTGFGTALIDLNNDGLLDIYVANGRVAGGDAGAGEEKRYSELNQLFEGLGDHTFREVFPRGGTQDPLVHSSRGAAFGDYDNDGDVDIFVVNRDAPAYVLNNRGSPVNHWTMFRVVNHHGADAIGARVQIEVDGHKRFRDVRTGYSYCASNDPRVHFGLGTVSRVDGVEVRWVDGTVQRFGSFTADQIVELKRSKSAGGTRGRSSR
ncbi:MAG: CRTAC1 family protein [Phycisphaerae bacterium]